MWVIICIHWPQVAPVAPRRITKSVLCSDTDGLDPVLDFKLTHFCRLDCRGLRKEIGHQCYTTFTPSYYYLFCWISCHSSIYLGRLWVLAWISTPVAPSLELCNLKGEGKVGVGAAPGAWVTPLHCRFVNLTDRHLVRFHFTRVRAKDRWDANKDTKKLICKQWSYVNLYRKQ